MTEDPDLDTPVVIRINSSNKRTVHYHLPDCRYVEDAPRTRQLRLGEVRLRPYSPCSKCKPDTPEASR